MFTKLVSGATLAFAVAAFAAPANAMPIFAQRYHMQCAACHTAMPELNDFGNWFRDHGYRFPKSVPRHGTTIAALRYNLDWERNPPPGIRRFSPSASILGNDDIGAVSAYLHYGLGNGGAPGSVYLGYLSTYDDHTHSLFRLGLYELPLPQSPGQRLDDISEYGYLGTSVGQNDLDLNAPRLGIEGEREIGVARLALSVAMGEFKGAAYGGAPVFTGAETVAARPELELFAKAPLAHGVTVNVVALDGERAIHLPGKAVFDDPYDRLGAGIEMSFFKKRLDLEAEQFVGRDDDADGSGDAIDSSGGWTRLKYFVTPHLYAAVRYDGAANPFPTRTLVQYVGAMVGGHARIVLERRNNLLHGGPTLGGYLVVGVPWPLGL